MAWPGLFSCFNVRSRSPRRVRRRRAKPNKEEAAKGFNDGKSSSAAVSHDQKDLYIVRGSPNNKFVAVNSTSHDKQSLVESYPPSLKLDDREKKADLFKKKSHLSEKTEGCYISLNDECCDMNATSVVKNPDSELQKVYDGSLKPLPNKQSIAINKHKRESSEDRRAYQEEWLVSTVLNDEPVMETSTTAQYHYDYKTLENKVDADSLKNIKCTEFNLFGVEIRNEELESSKSRAHGDGLKIQTLQTYDPTLPSSPMFFAEESLNAAKLECMETNDDLLLDNIDVSSLIENSDLVNDWENSYHELGSKDHHLNDRSIHVMDDSEVRYKENKQYQPLYQEVEGSASSNTVDETNADSNRDSQSSPDSHPDFSEHTEFGDNFSSIRSECASNLTSERYEQHCLEQNDRDSHLQLSPKMKKDFIEGHYDGSDAMLGRILQSPSSTSFGSECRMSTSSIEEQTQLCYSGDSSDNNDQADSDIEDRSNLLRSIFGHSHESTYDSTESISSHDISDVRPRAIYLKGSLSMEPTTPMDIKKPFSSYSFLSRYSDDRPILGTVAAHWSPISTKKWWDGKGIPNSTNKYKEDQKVSWHSLPFEVRLEQALANQDTKLST